MKKLISLFFFILTLFSISCNDKVADPIKDDPEWEKIEITTVGTVYSFIGSLDTSLIIGTPGSILKSDDFGNSWDNVYNTENYVSGFIIRNDTVFALTNFDDYFSRDGGESWAPLNYDILPSQNKSVVTSDGIIFKIEPRAYGELAHPTLVLESRDNGNNWTEIFPYKHYIYSIYLDNSDRLYLGINGWEWDEEIGSFNPSSGTKAIIYFLESGK